ncbi:MAG TPA: hypothetical protein VIQ48_02995, partial [Rhodanobacter sp.]
TLNNLDPSIFVIEDLLDEEANKVIRTELKLSTNPSKVQIRRFFQERLARNDLLPLGSRFLRISSLLIDSLSQRLVR